LKYYHLFFPRRGQLAPIFKLKKPLLGFKKFYNKMVYDVGIVVLAKGLEKSGEGKWQSDLDARLNLAAAVARYNRYRSLGYHPFLVLTGGQIDKSQPILSEIMRVEAIDKGVLMQDIFAEKKSVDTTENAQFSKPLISANLSREGRLEVITNFYHLKRSRDCFKIHGMSPLMISSESELIAYYPEQIKNYLGSERIKERARINKLYNLALTLVGEKPFRWYAHRLIEKNGWRNP
jgi:uncharacterized SAM-binding protein YcdF (DUF218 family)